MKILLLLLLSFSAFAQFTPFPPSPVPPDSIVTKGGLLTSDGAVQIELPKFATDNYVLVTDQFEPTGLKWVLNQSSPTTTQGDLIVRGNVGVDVNLPIGLDNQVLTVDLANGLYKMAWETPSGGATINHSFFTMTSGVTLATNNTPTNLYNFNFAGTAGKDIIISGYAKDAPAYPTNNTNVGLLTMSGQCPANTACTISVEYSLRDAGGNIVDTVIVRHQPPKTTTTQTVIYNETCAALQFKIPSAWQAATGPAWNIWVENKMVGTSTQFSIINDCQLLFMDI